MNTTEENAIFRVSSKDVYSTWEEFEKRWTNLYRYLKEHHSNLFGDISTHTHANETGGSTIDHVNLANKGTNTHAQIDSHIGDSSDPHGGTLSQTSMLVSNRLWVNASNVNPGILGFNISGSGVYDSNLYAYQVIHNSNQLQFQGYTGDGNMSSVTTLSYNGNWYFPLNVSADSFTDRTTWFEGNAVDELAKISGKDGELDHSTLDPFMSKDIEVVEDGINKVVKGRNLGGTITVLTVAVQQLAERIVALEKSVIELKGK